jgi:hypothetical protein
VCEPRGVVGEIAAARFLPAVANVVAKGNNLASAVAVKKPASLAIARKIFHPANGNKSIKALSGEVSKFHNRKAVR